MKNIVMKLLIIIILCLCITCNNNIYSVQYTASSWEKYYDFSSNRVNKDKIDSVTDSSQGKDWIIYRAQEIIDPISEEDLKKWEANKIKQYAEVCQYFLSRANLGTGNIPTNIRNSREKIKQRCEYLSKMEPVKEDQELSGSIENSVGNTNNREENEEATDITTGGNEGEVEEEKEPIQAELGTSIGATQHTVDEIINEGNAFIQQGKNGTTTLVSENLTDASQTIYNIVLAIGIVIVTAIGAYLGIKFMVASAEDRAQLKQALIPYFAGCFVIFSAYAIWAIIINLMSGLQ